MPDTHRKLTINEMKERWKTPEGLAFREEIIRQLQSEETRHQVDRENLRITIYGKEEAWIDFPGVREVNNNPQWCLVKSFLPGSLIIL